MTIKNLTLLTAAVCLAWGCSQNRVQVTKSGLKYQIHEDANGNKAKVGDVISMQLVMKTVGDSALRNTYKDGTPIRYVLQAAPFKGAFEEGLLMLSKGDSATFFVSSDSLFKQMGSNMPPFIRKGSDIKFITKVVDVQSAEDFQKSQQADRKKQVDIDSKILADYAAKNGLKNVQKTESGLHYVVVTAGNGAKPQKADQVSVHYAGRLLTGKEFDNSRRNPQSGGRPIDFQIGVGGVIPGWDEGVMLMPKGSKYTFLIPSSLAYGEQGVPGNIPPNSPLVFDVELIDIKKSAQ